MRDEWVGTGQHVLRALGAGEGVSGDVCNVAVVTYDARKRDSVEVSPLGAGKHPFSLPPEPER